MPLTGVHHVNILAGLSDLPAIEKFYSEGLGMKVGSRPDFPAPGIWLYSGDHPLVHVSVHCDEHYTGNDAGITGYDHVAFDVSDPDEYTQRLTLLGVSFDAQNVANAGFQIFTHDPVGNKVELNFPNGEAPQDIAVGTLSKTQFPDHAT